MTLMPNVSRPITVIEVAKEAGVSVGTVSRVLNGYQNISAENKRKVQHAVRVLGYEPLRTTRGPYKSMGPKKRTRTGNLGVIFTEIGPEWSNHPLFAEYVKGIDEACSRRGYHFIIEWGQDRDIPRCIREGKVDGILIKTTNAIPAFLRSLSASFPVVFMGINDPITPVEQTAQDDFGAGYAATRYLWNRGHRSIAFLSNHQSHSMLFGRQLGYEKFLRKMNALRPSLIAVDDSANKSVPSDASPEIEVLLDKVLSVPESERPTAILTANDWMAKSVYQALANRNLHVPDDISVMGFDNVVAVCEAMSPSLTSYEIPFAAVARESALTLIDKLEGAESSTTTSARLIRGDIVERQSVRDCLPDV